MGNEQQTAGKNKSEQDWCHARSEATTDVHRPSGQERKREAKQQVFERHQ